MRRKIHHKDNKTRGSENQRINPQISQIRADFDRPAFFVSAKSAQSADSSFLLLSGFFVNFVTFWLCVVFLKQP